MNSIGKLFLASVSAAAIATPAFAQDANQSSEQALSDASATDNAIIVTARRRDENVQEVPIVINTVTAEKIADLNLRDFEDVENIVPGLELSSQGFSGGGSIRGVAFDTRVSGNNASLEFYLNDTPMNGNAILQQMYDIGQIEVLRGPQGTLRGRASPSGSLTVTTRKPDLYEAGGTVSLTANDIGTQNINGGVGVPIIEGVLAVRAAGIYDVGDANEVRTSSAQALDKRDPYDRSIGGRFSAVLQPTDWLLLEGMYQVQDTRSRVFTQVESANIADPSQPTSPVFISGKDRLSIEDAPTRLDQKFDTFTWKAQLSGAGQNLIYVGNYRKTKVFTFGDDDNANAFPGFEFGQVTDSRSTNEAHELRLQNESRLFDMVDYVVGVFHQKNNADTVLDSQTLVTLPPFLGGGVATVSHTPILRPGTSKETSAFGNLTFHIGDALEVSGGLRYIDYKSDSQLLVSGVNIVDEQLKDDKLIYTGSVNYFVNPDVMVYASLGTSYRPGPTAIGDFSIIKSDLQRSFTTLPPETSTSYEVGVKSTLMGGRLRFNLAGYYQKFKNYPYRSGGNGVFYQTFSAVRDATGAVIGVSPSVDDFNFVAAVPVEVKGVEGEISFDVTPDWSFNLNASYSDGQIKNGLIPCNDLDQDGVPDVLTSAPTLQQVQDAYGSDNVGACNVSLRSGFQSPFAATAQSEYRFPITDGTNAFARGLFSYYGKSKNDPSNQFDDISGYGLLNLYAGLRGADGGWELSAYAKNILDTFRVLNREGTPTVTNFRELQPPTFRTVVAKSTSSTYRQIDVTAPREFGVTFRTSFGSR
ncbi:TonB-dependent receptor [Novosphingobium endophyticum]|uniref:TonB-dependent receptor n=1 Tax=Novosphingobium endophyticum TaxID=1955250 RepID=A0A916TP73_9SPHN|nr:TonB-dependent receptor [Novosphingobium endophyticum]GGB85893.1 TonB-dependent receptor [Novosphingobium endophyticum]